ncbi:MAG: hypothetical protein ACP5PV_01375 [Methanothrix sp.]
MIMPKSCTICEDPRRDEFDRRARIEDNIAKIAQDFALSYDAFYRHVKANHHIREVTAKPTASELTTSEEIYKEIVIWHKEARDLQQKAKSDGDIKTALLGLEKALKCLELMAKINGQIQEQNININLQQVSIYQSPEWSKVGAALADLLSPYPELRREVAGRLLELARGKA